MKKKNNVRYWSRDEIEQIVKNRHIDWTRFYEYSKTDYERVIKKFYYSFCEYEKDTDIILDYCWIRFRENLEITGRVYGSIGWYKMLQSIKENMEYNWDKKLYLIVDDGWVYEGYIDEIVIVLGEITGNINDFYIVSLQFDRMAVYCDDGDCIVYYKKMMGIVKNEDEEKNI